MASIAQRQRPRLSKSQRRQVRQRQARKAWAARRQLRQVHQHLPRPARGWFDALHQAFTGPTALPFTLLVCAAILTVGNHTVLNLLRTLGPLVPGDPSSYHRVLSHRRWSSGHLATFLASWALGHLLSEGAVFRAGDDTVEEHRGKHVHGQARPRDPVRSTPSCTAFRWGHKGVVRAVLVRFPFTRRRWALPLLVALYRSEEDNRRLGRRHKTPPELLGQLLRLLRRWFPGRRFVCAADGNYATHALARLATRPPDRLTYRSPFYANANRYEPPPPPPPGKKAPGRPRQKGEKLAAPAQVVARAKRRQRRNVAWYGGGRRDVEVVTGTGQGYQAGEGLVAVLWVGAHDGTGTHREEYFFTTDVRWTAAAVLETYTGRGNLETTFEEMRAYLGLETTRGWAEKTVLRAAPCLFGRYTVVAVRFAQLPARARRGGAIAWPGKQDTTFSDAITCVRRWLWVEGVFAIPGHRLAFSKLSRPFQQLLLAGLAPPA